MPAHFQHPWRSDFPILNIEREGAPLIYLDNAATTQKPQVVIDAISHHYATNNANVHRGVYSLSQLSTEAFEQTREKVRCFINARSITEIVFTKGATESINLVASSFGEYMFHQGDEIILTIMEHHANIIPWQQIAEKKGCIIKVVPISENGTLDLDTYKSYFNSKTKFVSMVWVSNAIGVENPIKECIEIAHNNNVPILIDASQSIQHLHINVQDLDCDFLVFSGHKIYGPSGTGVLYGKERLLEVMPPYQTGGDMIKKVTFEKTTFADLPSKFEAGTPNIEGCIGLGASIDYINGIGIKDIVLHEQGLMKTAIEAIQSYDFLQILGYNGSNVSALSFTMKGVHPHDIASILDKKGICIRAGHHCAHPLMQFYKVSSTSRISFALYTTHDEIIQCIDELASIYALFS
ncbi:MAG: SufS family cysteine desulfurase [Bacteroidetes bacterium]|nr:SufS family cysteine desulfurase [bacterium]NBP64533.1 SufS family cysteine desulfurase [Bacteroidota bacterium]